MTLQKLLNYLETDNIFLSGGAGVGKSYLTNKVIEHYQSKDKNVIPLGSTGISARRDATAGVSVRCHRTGT